MNSHSPIYFDDEEYSTLATISNGHTGNSLCSFRDGMFCQFTGEDQPDGGLDFAGGDG